MISEIRYSDKSNYSGEAIPSLSDEELIKFFKELNGQIKGIKDDNLIDASKLIIELGGLARQNSGVCVGPWAEALFCLDFCILFIDGKG